jgi:hypothetical protein
MSPKGTLNSLLALIAFRKPEKQGIERGVFMASIQSIPLKNRGRTWRLRIKYTYNGVQRVKTKQFLADKYSKKDVQAWARKREAQLMEAEVICAA